MKTRREKIGSQGILSELHLSRTVPGYGWTEASLQESYSEPGQAEVGLPVVL